MTLSGQNRQEMKYISEMENKLLSRLHLKLKFGFVK